RDGRGKTSRPVWTQPYAFVPLRHASLRRRLGHTGQRRDLTSPREGVGSATPELGGGELQAFEGVDGELAVAALSAAQPHGRTQALAVRSDLTDLQPDLAIRAGVRAEVRGHRLEVEGAVVGGGLLVD